MESQSLTSSVTSWFSSVLSRDETPVCWSVWGACRRSSSGRQPPRSPWGRGTCPAAAGSHTQPTCPRVSGTAPQHGIWRDREGRLHWELRPTSSTHRGPSPRYLRTWECGGRGKSGQPARGSCRQQRSQSPGLSAGVRSGQSGGLSPSPCSALQWRGTGALLTSQSPRSSWGRAAVWVSSGSSHLPKCSVEASDVMGETDLDHHI